MLPEAHLRIQLNRREKSLSISRWLLLTSTPTEKMGQTFNNLAPRRVGKHKRIP